MSLLNLVPATSGALSPYGQFDQDQEDECGPPQPLSQRSLGAHPSPIAPYTPFWFQQAQSIVLTGISASFLWNCYNPNGPQNIEFIVHSERKALSRVD